MAPALAADAAVKIFLDAERAELYRRIDARFDAMLASGALDEAHGVPWLLRAIAGEIDLAAAAEEGKRDTRRYTKRQATWFRHQLPDWTWVTPDMALGEIRREVVR